MTAPERRLVGRATRALRTEQWWAHMLGPIVAFACLDIGWRQVGPGDAWPRVAGLLWTAVALAAYGYVVNDAADVESDRRAGKPNSMARLRPPVRVAVAAALAALGAVPWALIDIDLPALVPLVGCYVLPIAYSCRPLRLKEHPLLGPVSDASNAFVLPALFTIALFAPLGEAAGPPPLIVVGAVAWATGFGLRAIVLHQVDDAENDARSGTRTLVTTIGERHAVRLMRIVLFPLELLGLVLLGATVATWAPWLVAAGLAVLVAFHALRLTGVLDRTLTVAKVEDGWLLSWTQVWPALVLSVALAVEDWRSLGFVALVVVLFRPRLATGLRHLRAVLANERLRHARA